MHATWLVGQLGQAAVCLDADEATGVAALTTKYAPGGISEAFARTRKDAFMAQRPDHPAQAKSASVPPGAAGVFNEAVGLDQQGVIHFNSLDRQITGVGDMHLNAVFAVFVNPPAKAPAQGLEIDVSAAGAWVNA